MRRPLAQWADKAMREKMCEAMCDRPMSDEQKAKIAAGLRERYKNMSPEEWQAMTAAAAVAARRNSV